jgi:Cytochrome P460
MRLWICGLMVSWLGITSAGHAEELTITEQSVFSFYKSLDLLTPSPIIVSVELAIKCTTPTAAELAADERRTGPHSDAFVNLYVNELAKRAIADKAVLFPTGAVIVKEKLKRDVSATAVGGMVKRAAGFDPDHGDWEYFYAAKSGGFASGRLDNCIACHTQAKSRDYVFFAGQQF